MSQTPHDDNNDDMISDELCNITVIENQRGLHARAAVKFAKLAESFTSDVTIARGDMKVTARSIMGLMMLAASQGTSITICARGADAMGAVSALSDLVKRKFDEEE